MLLIISVPVHYLSPQFHSHAFVKSRGGLLGMSLGTGVRGSKNLRELEVGWNKPLFHNNLATSYLQKALQCLLLTVLDSQVNPV